MRNQNAQIGTYIAILVERRLSVLAYRILSSIINEITQHKDRHIPNGVWHVCDITFADLLEPLAFPTELLENAAAKKGM